MRSYSVTIRPFFLILIVTLFSCNTDSDKPKTEAEAKTVNQLNSLPHNQESVLLMYEAIKKHTEKYSKNGNWRYVIERKGKWKFDPDLDESISIDISTEPQVSIIFRMGGVSLISNVKDYLSKGDTLIFNTSNIHNENQTFMFFPIDRIKKIVQWATFDDNKITPFGNFMNDTLVVNK